MTFKQRIKNKLNKAAEYHDYITSASYFIVLALVIIGKAQFYNHKNNKKTN